MASFREIKKILNNLWLEEPTQAPGPECENGKRTLNSPIFTDMQLSVQKQAIGYIEKDCFQPLAEKYNESYQKYPATENDCTRFLYITNPPYCKG